MLTNAKRIQFVVLFVMLYFFRTFFGLSKTFYGNNDISSDALQTYLIGLKSYTTGTWPYFGPDQYDLSTGFHFQIAGALEGLVIGLPFRILPIPEAPFLFLNLLSLGAIALFAWYVSKQFKNLSLFFIFAWMALLPWTLNESTHVFNVSYLLLGSILFFLGFFEAIPQFSIQWLPPFGAYGLMGLGLFWDMQFHQSWVLLVPFMLGVFVWRRKLNLKGSGAEVLGFIAGSILPLACLLPTLIQYGFLKPTGGLAHAATGFNGSNFKAFLTILARYLSLPSFEIPRFLGGHTSDREAFLKQVPMIIPPAVFLTLVGWVQPFVLLFCPLFPKGRTPLLIRFYGLTMAAFLLVWGCFCFATTGPSAHMYYVLLPLAAMYAFAVWDRWALKPFWKNFAVVCLAASLWFQAGAALRLMTTDSIYKDRPKIVKAIEEKDYRILAQRRPWVEY